MHRKEDEVNAKLVIGWLSPLIWSLSRPYADRVARSLVEYVEKAALATVSGKKKSLHDSCFDF